MMQSRAARRRGKRPSPPLTAAPLKRERRPPSGAVRPGSPRGEALGGYPDPSGDRARRPDGAGSPTPGIRLTASRGSRTSPGATAALPPLRCLGRIRRLPGTLTLAVDGPRIDLESGAPQGLHPAEARDHPPADEPEHEQQQRRTMANASSGPCPPMASRRRCQRFSQNHRLTTSCSGLPKAV